MIGKRNERRLGCDEGRKLLLLKHLLDGGVPLSTGCVVGKSECHRHKQNDLGNRWIGDDDLLLLKPTLHALLQTLRQCAITIDSDHTHLHAFVAAHIEERVEKRLLRLVAEGGEVVQNEKKRNVADLCFLQHDLQKLHVLKLRVFESFVYVTCYTRSNDAWLEMSNDAR